LSLHHFTGMKTTALKYSQDSHKPITKAGVQGFEPQLTDPESAVLPLNDTPSNVICGHPLLVLLESLTTARLFLIRD
jgi:hypothetical protein